MDVAVLGLGAMGSRIAGRLLASDRRVVVWNRTAEKAAELVRLGAEQAETPASAAESVDVVITMLANPEALEAVASEFVPSLHERQTVVEMSTVGQAAVERLRGTLPSGVALVDAPVLGSIAEAESGTLAIFVGGSEADVARVHPLLSELGTPIHVGPPGAGAAAKLVANSTLFGVLVALGEALKLADALGLDRAATFDVLARTPLAAQAERRKDAFERGEYPRRFALYLARKDADLLVEAAPELRVARAALAWLADAEQAGLGNSDYTAVLKTIAGGQERTRPG